ncbi:hypothetical protein D9619_007884 [Psilocybe cf. subviscida]|uniref:Uncharacterized protein n=1 Tax=Psilocybe cf. subviscida TaxID=2480587 RepID=A0A8H5AVU1_9AGAR|nr:hypothetical protein D9619_007884 [Psilocybe cf. subviscida]
MSPGAATPRTPVYRRVDDDRDMLESLKGLSIKGFYDDDESAHHVSTPTSTNASLSTPPALRSSRVFLASSPYALDDSLWVPSEQWTSSATNLPRSSAHAWYSEELQYPIQMPNAPMMKDLDSFTDGTGQGSFDFPLSTGGDDVLPLIFHPPTPYDDIDTPTTDQPHNSLALDLLPSPSDLNDVVLAWREGVSATTSPSLLPALAPSPEAAPLAPPPKKRRRSLTLDSDHPSLDRRVRAWSPDVELFDFSLPSTEAVASETCGTGRSEPPAPG